MRQLLLVFVIFILSILGLIALFNTVTNTSKQSNIALVTQLPTYPQAAEHLTTALQWSSSNDSLGQLQLDSFYHWVQQTYPSLFDNPNVEWQEFGPSNWVAKWVGRKADLAPIVWMASPQVNIPTKAQQAAWSVSPFSGHLTSTHIYGQGSQGSKAAMIAMLEVLHAFVQKNRLPDRTIYLAFPFPAQVGEEQILQALAQAGTPAEYILQTGGLIAKDLLWELPTPVALVGIGQMEQAQVKVVRKHPTMNWKVFLGRLQKALPTADLEHETAQELLAQLSPELSFRERFVFSNSWLLDWSQQSYFCPSSLPHQLVGTSVQLSPALPDSDTAWLKVAAPLLEQASLSYIQELLKTDSVIVVSNWKIQKGGATAATESRSYRLLGNTCKEIFPNLMTAPIWVNRPQPLTFSTIQAPIFYFHPIIQDSNSWEKAKWGITERVSRQNYERLLQFYYQLLTNSI